MSYFSEIHYTGNHVSRDIYDIFFKKGMKILDIGCSTGSFLMNDPKNIIGIDIDKDAIQVSLNKGLNAIYYNANDKLPFNDNYFDGVHCRFVIEHLDNPLNLLKEIKRILKYKGICVLITDNVNVTKYNFWHDYTHKHPFNPDALTRIFFDAGFKDFKIEYQKGFPGSYWAYYNGWISLQYLKNIRNIMGKIFNQKEMIMVARNNFINMD